MYLFLALALTNQTVDNVLGYDEALIVVYADKWIITSPNMTNIPFFPIERVSVRPRLDGGLGDEDFTMSPQIFSPQYRHRVLIRCRPREETNLSVMWWRPSPDNFVRLSRSSYQSLGRVHSRSIPIIDEMSWRLRDRAYRLISKNSSKNLGTLESLISGMRHGVNRLKHSPYTLRELVLDVAQTQRMYLEGLAMCEYLEDHWDQQLQSVGPTKRPTHTEYMGAWTTDPTVVQMLQHAGIPVYFVRPRGTVDDDAKLIKLQPSFQRDGRIVTAEWLATTREELAVPERYCGIPGEDMHRAASQLNRYGDLATYILGINGEQDIVPVGARGSISVPPAPQATKKRSKTRGKQNNCKYIEFHKAWSATQYAQQLKQRPQRPVARSGINGWKLRATTFRRPFHHGPKRCCRSIAWNDKPIRPRKHIQGTAFRTLAC